MTAVNDNQPDWFSFEWEGVGIRGYGFGTMHTAAETIEEAREKLAAFLEQAYRRICSEATPEDIAAFRAAIEKDLASAPRVEPTQRREPEDWVF